MGPLPWLMAQLGFDFLADSDADHDADLATALQSAATAGCVLSLKVVLDGFMCLPSAPPSPPEYYASDKHSTTRTRKNLERAFASDAPDCGGTHVASLPRTSSVRIYPSKRMLGVHNISLGMCFNYSLGIAFIGKRSGIPLVRRALMAMMGTDRHPRLKPLPLFPPQVRPSHLSDSGGPSYLRLRRGADRRQALRRRHP